MIIKNAERRTKKIVDVEFELTEEEYARLEHFARTTGTTPEQYLKTLMERGV